MRRLLIPVAILLAIASLAYGATFTKGPEPPDSWFVIDVNNDGLDDILTGDSIYVNTGGTFTFVKRLDLQLAERIHAAADINGDGFPDLFTYSESAGAPASSGIVPAGLGTNFILLSDGAFHYTRVVAPFNETRSVSVVMDIDRDGKDDFVTSLPVWDNEHTRVLNGLMVIFRSKGDGRFEEWQKITVPVPPMVFAVGDVTGDGRDDLVSQVGDELWVFPATSDNGLSDPIIRYLPFSFGALARGGSYMKQRLVDIDGDGNNDIVLKGPSRVFVLFGDGHGSFPRYASVDPPDTRPNTTMRPAVFGNFTSNARMDIAVSTGDGSFFVYSGVNGTLKEVSRNLSVVPSQFTLTAGAFHVPSQRTDLILTPFGYASYWAPPLSLYFGSTPAPAPVKTATNPVTRARAVLHPRPVEIVNVSVKLVGDCAPDYSDTWRIVREGIFGIDRGTNREIDAAIDDDVISYRIVSRSGTGIPQFSGTLAPIGDGHYIDFVAVDTACGTKGLRLEATINK